MDDLFDENKKNIFIDFLRPYGIDIKKNEYTRQFINYHNNNEKYENYIEIELKKFFNETLMTDIKMDINGVIENIKNLINLKMDDTIEKIGLKEILDIKNEKKYNKISKYNKYLYFCVLKEKRKNQDNDFLINYVIKNVDKLRIPSILTLCKIKDKMKYIFRDNIEEINNFEEMIFEMFDDEKTIKKFLGYIRSINEKVQENYENEEEEIKENLKYLLRNMRCDGYLFFNNFLKNLYNTHKGKLDIEDITRDKKLVNYLIYLTKNYKKDSSLTTNKILLSMKMFLDDIESSYFDTLNYRKINIKNTSEKYKNINKNEIKRNKINFVVLRNSLQENKLYNCNVPKDILLYSDILNSYYKARYPDRKLNMDWLSSTIIVKIKFDVEDFILEMNMLQYEILKLIIDGNGETDLCKIIEKTEIDLDVIEKIINGFLKLEIIKRTNENINRTKFIKNEIFSHKNNRLNIVQKITSIENVEEKSYLFEKSKIIYCNLIDFMKKNSLSYFTIEELFNITKDRLKFEITKEEIFHEIKYGIDVKEDIEERDTLEKNEKTQDEDLSIKSKSIDLSIKSGSIDLSIKSGSIDDLSIKSGSIDDFLENGNDDVKNISTEKLPVKNKVTIKEYRYRL